MLNKVYLFNEKYTLKVNWYINTEAGQFVDKHVIQFLGFLSS